MAAAMTPMIAMQGASTIMGVMGAQAQGNAAMQAAQGKQRAAYYSAEQLKRNAGQAEAASQLDAQEEIRKGKLLQSRALALAAASGGGAMDPGVLRILSGIAAEGELAKEKQLYKGAERARGMRDQASALYYEGDQYIEAGAESKKAANISSLRTVMSGTKSLYDAGAFKGWG